MARRFKTGIGCNWWSKTGMPFGLGGRNVSLQHLHAEYSGGPYRFGGRLDGAGSFNEGARGDSRITLPKPSAEWTRLLHPASIEALTL